MAEPDVHVVERRRFIVDCDVAITQQGYRWRFPNAFAPFSTEVYGSIDEAIAGAQQFAQQRMVPITPAKV